MKKLLYLIFLIPILTNAQNTWENLSPQEVSNTYNPFLRTSEPLPTLERPYKWEIRKDFLYRISKTNDTLKFGPFTTPTGYSIYWQRLVQSTEGKVSFYTSYYGTLNGQNNYKNSVGYCDGITLQLFNESSDNVAEINKVFTSIAITKNYIWVSQESRIHRYTIADKKHSVFSGGLGNTILNPISYYTQIEGDSAGQVYMLNVGRFYRYADSTNLWENLTPDDSTIKANPGITTSPTYLAGKSKLYIFEKGIMKSFPTPQADLLSLPTSVYFYSKNQILKAHYGKGFVIMENGKVYTTLFKDFFQPTEPLFDSRDNGYDYSFSEKNHFFINISPRQTELKYIFIYKNGKVEYKGLYPLYSSGTAYVDADDNFYYSYIKFNYTITPPPPNTLIRIKNQVDTSRITLPHSNYVYTMKEDKNFIWLGIEGSNLISITRLKKSENLIQGFLYYDFSKNGVKDAGDIPINKFPVIIYPKGITLFPSDNGQFSFFGNSDEQYTLAIPGDSSFNFTSQKLPATLFHNTVNEIGISLKNVIPSVKTNFYMPWPRCNTKPMASLNIVNNGFVAIEKLTLTLSADGKTKLFLDTAATKGGDSLKFEITNLGIGATKRIEYAIGIPGPGTTSSVKLNSSIYSNNTISYSKSDSISSIVRCSFDPNDKAVSPAGVGEENFTLKKSRLTYLIRFENTGNDTAYHVVIKDTLSASLNKSTFEVLGSSHSVVTEKTKQGVLTFTFHKIMLPDSTTNKAKAQGWVRFAISPTTDLPEGTAINNKAYIVFDSNDPIITNTVSNTMVTTIPVVLNVDETTRSESSSFYPNPAKEYIQASSEVLTTEIYNSFGKLVLESQVKVIDLSILNNGLYLVKSYFANGVITQNKLIKN